MYVHDGFNTFLCVIDASFIDYFDFLQAEIYAVATLHRCQMRLPCKNKKMCPYLDCRVW